MDNNVDFSDTITLVTFLLEKKNKKKNNKKYKETNLQKEKKTPDGIERRSREATCVYTCVYVYINRHYSVTDKFLKSMIYHWIIF